MSAFNEAYADQGIQAVDANMDEYTDLAANGPYGYGPDVLYQANEMCIRDRTESAYDPGTGLFNKRAINEYTIEKIRDCQNTHEGLYLAIIDVEMCIRDRSSYSTDPLCISGLSYR